MANNYADRTHCNNNHEFTPENTFYRSDGYRGCRTCKREKAARARARQMSNESKRESYREKNRLYMRKLRAVERGDVEALKKYDDKATTPHNLLGIKPAAEALWTQFNDYLDHNRTPCKDKPELYSDYDDPRYPDEATGVPMPTTGQAEALCRECPVRDLCLQFALKQKEDFGVYGGKRVVAGRIYQGGSGRNGS